MTTTTTGRTVDVADLAFLTEHYGNLVKAGNNSVRQAWRFGQALDSRLDSYTRKAIAEAMNLSVATIGRYLKFYYAYQRPELAEQAAELLETFNIDIITELRDDLAPIGHGRPMAGRHYRYRCTNCGGHEVRREEIDPDAADEPGAIPEVRFEGVPRA